jgi:flavin reductase (DIM6/NTAB) family NADH-FMN oxidoreductase RutF
MRKVQGSKVYRFLYPVVPAVVAASSAGRVAAMPVVSLVSLSSDPPLVGFSSLPSHTTYKTIIEAGLFSVSWLDRRYAKAVTEMGTSTGGRGPDKLKAVGLHHSPGRSLGVPVIEEASATLECRFAASQRLGDHNLVIGEVKGAEAVEDFGDYWAFREYRPMLYSGLGHPMGKLARDRPVTRP